MQGERGSDSPGRARQQLRRGRTEPDAAQQLFAHRVLQDSKPTKSQKTLGINDFYFGDSEWPYPLAAVQILGKSGFDAPRVNPTLTIIANAPRVADVITERHSRRPGRYARTARRAATPTRITATPPS